MSNLYPATLIRDAHEMASLTRHLHLIVSRMAVLYGADDGLNTVQPDGFPDIIAASLDEWAVSIGPVAQAWVELASDMESAQ